MKHTPSIYLTVTLYTIRRSTKNGKRIRMIKRIFNPPPHVQSLEVRKRGHLFEIRIVIPDEGKIRLGTGADLAGALLQAWWRPTWIDM